MSLLRRLSDFAERAGPRVSGRPPSIPPDTTYLTPAEAASLVALIEAAQQMLRQQPVTVRNQSAHAQLKDALAPVEGKP